MFVGGASCKTFFCHKCWCSFSVWIRCRSCLKVLNIFFSYSNQCILALGVVVGAIVVIGAIKCQLLQAHVTDFTYISLEFSYCT